MSKWNEKKYGGNWIKLEWRMRGVICDIRLSCKNVQNDHYEKFDEFSLSPKAHHHHNKVTLHAIVKTEYAIDVNYKDGKVATHGKVNYPGDQKEWDETIDHVFSPADIDRKARKFLDEHFDVIKDLAVAAEAVFDGNQAQLKIIHNVLTTLPKGIAAKSVPPEVKGAMVLIEQQPVVAEVLKTLKEKSFYSFIVEGDLSLGDVIGVTCAVGYCHGLIKDEMRGLASLGVTLGVDYGFSGGVSLGVAKGNPSSQDGWEVGVALEGAFGPGFGLIVTVEIAEDKIDASSIRVMYNGGIHVKASGGFGATATFPPFILP